MQPWQPCLYSPSPHYSGWSGSPERTRCLPFEQWGSARRRREMMNEINAMTHLAFLQFKANTAIKQLLGWVHIVFLFFQPLTINWQIKQWHWWIRPTKAFLFYFFKDLSVALQWETQSELTKACGRPGARNTEWKRRSDWIRQEVRPVDAKSTNSRVVLFIIHTQRTGALTAMQDCRWGPKSY